MLAQVGLYEIVAVLVYLMLTGYLGWLGWRRTRSAADYMLGGRKTHPFIMALSYGATFISTSAIIGFGGVAGQLGMSLLWLVFLNIFVGIFLAFVLLGTPTRRMGHALDAHTFPELLGRRFQSKSIQVFAGLMIFLAMPLYAGAVIIGGCKFISTQFALPYDWALLFFTGIVAVYVFFGGLKGVMYTDAFQGAIMIVAMLLLLGVAYVSVGGVTDGHRQLTDLAALVPAGAQASGHNGFTAMPDFGWGSGGYSIWWMTVTTIILGVGIGVLAQPQLIVRFMTVKSRKELNRAVILGGLFILLIPGSAYVVGAISNVYFTHEGPRLTGTIVKMIDESKGYATMRVQTVEGSKLDEDFRTQQTATQPAVTAISGQTVGVVLQRGADGAFVHPEGKGDLFVGRGMANTYAVRQIEDPANPGKYKIINDVEQIIPRYIKMALPPWFATLFLLTLLAAAMSTLSGQFHALGTSIGRDCYEQLAKAGPGTSHNRSLHIARFGTLIGIVLATAVAWWANTAGKETLIARGTAIFFGLCTAMFLPAFIGGLFWRRMTRTGALASMIVGALISAFWLILINAKSASDIGIVQQFTGGKASLLWQFPNWPDVDATIVAFPLSALTAIVVSLFTRKNDAAHLDRCFAKTGPGLDISIQAVSATKP